MTPPTPATALRAEAVAAFMHDFCHGGQGPWEQPGGAKHRALDTEKATAFLAALAVEPPALTDDNPFVLAADVYAAEPPALDDCWVCGTHQKATCPSCGTQGYLARLTREAE